MSGLTKHKLNFFPGKLNCSDMIGSHTLDGYGQQITSHVEADGYYALDVHTFFDAAYLDQDGYLQVTVTNPTPSASDYAEDSGHVSGDMGTFALGVRNDLNAVMTDADFDYSAFAVDAYGRLKTLTYFDPSLLSVDGYLNVNLAAPIEVNVDINAEYMEDSGHASGDIGNFVLAGRNDTNAVLTSTDLDYSPFAVDAYGRLNVNVKYDPSLLTDGYLNVNLASGAEIVECPLPVAGITGDAVKLATDVYRRLYINDSAHVGMLVSQNTIDSTSSELVLASNMPGRSRILIQNLGDCPIYIGHDSSVTDAYGFYVGGGNTFVAEAGDCIDFWAIAEEDGTDVRVMELG